MNAVRERTIVFWIPDWPVHAYLSEQRVSASDAAMQHSLQTHPAQPHSIQHVHTHEDAIALVSRRTVIACSAPARAEGVRVGIREREAQSRCPELQLKAHDPEVDLRMFTPVVAALRELVPEVEVIRPGLCAMRGRGPERYYGSEAAAAVALLGVASDFACPDARIGIADGVFAAEQAARSVATAPGVTAPHTQVRIVPTHETARFLSPIPIERAVAPQFADTLSSLGIRTLGALAALPEAAVRERFGHAGLIARDRATGSHVAAAFGSSEIQPQSPERDFAAELAFEPPLDNADQLAFACVTLAERFAQDLISEFLVCTSLRIELTDDIGVRHERIWSHPSRFTAADIVNRIRWQTAGMPQPSSTSASHRHGSQPGSRPTHSLPPHPGALEDRANGGISLVRISPVHTDRAAAHEPGLWNTEPDERVHHHLSRLQSKLGHTGVGTMELSGGRLLKERQRFVPWNTGRTAPSSSGRLGSPRARASAELEHRVGNGPWPGALTGPSPSKVFPQPLPAQLISATGRDITIDRDDLLETAPARLRVQGEVPDGVVRAWSRPWPVRERWWRGTPPQFRLQILLEGGDAWLLVRRLDNWYAEGRYD